MKTQARLVIFEGPDGGGKSTAARAVADHLRVRASHHGPYPGEEQIWRHYLDAMKPTIGCHNIVMDRSWLSEPIYGDVFRNSVNRISAIQCYTLQCHARLYNAVVVLCQPPMKICVENYRRRKELEYLENEVQLRAVWTRYAALDSHNVGLTVLRYDYTQLSIDTLIKKLTI